MFREATITAALVLAVLAIAVAWSRNSALQADLARDRASALRAQIQDRLMGTTVDLSSWTEGGEREPGLGTPTVLWVLDLDRCSGCFDQIGPWARLELLPDHNLVLLIVGEVGSAEEARLRVLRRTSIKTASRERVYDRFGVLRASTKFLLDSDGVVLLVDTRASGQSCGWSFEGQVAAIRGLSPATAIRQ